MRTAEDIIRDYLARGYTYERLRALANGRPEPIRGQMLEILNRDAGEDIVAALPEAEVEEEVILEEVPVMELGADEQISSKFAADAVAEDDADVEAEAETDTNGGSDAGFAVDYDAAEEVAAVASEAIAETPAAAAPLDFEADDSGTLGEVEEDVLSSLAIADTLAAARAESEPVAEVAVAPLVPALTMIEVERLTAAEYQSSRVAEDDAVERELIDLRISGGGEAWPDAGEVAQAEHSPATMEGLDSEIFVAFPEDVEESFDTGRVTKAAARSLEVIKNAMQDDPALAEMANQGSRIIALNPPYAVPGLEELDHPAGGEITVEKDESGLIKFPSEMVATYDAIISTRSLFSPAEEDVEEETSVAAEQAAETVAAAPAAERSEADGRIEAELGVLRSWLNELEDALKLKGIESEHLSKLLAERDESLEVQAQELSRLRAELRTDEARALEAQKFSSQLTVAREELASVRAEMSAMEREYNILATSTVPDLMQDKEDLIQMLEQEANLRQPLETQLAGSGRKLAVGYTLAAAASVLLVLSLGFHWVSGSTDAANARAQLAALDQKYQAMEASRDELASASAASEKLLNRKVNDLVASNAKLISTKNTLSARVTDLSARLAEAQKTLADARIPPRTPGDNERDNRAVFGGGNDRPLHHNDVTGVEQYVQRNLAPVSADTKSAVVREGESVNGVILRVLGVTNQQLVDWVVKKNALPLHPSQGYPIIHPGQTLMLPASADIGATSACLPTGRH